MIKRCKHKKHSLYSHKRGISTIVATVLLVLITVVTVIILWGSIFPLISQVAFTEDMNVNFKIEKGQYTSYDPDSGLLSIRVTRGSDSADISAIKFILTDESGNTRSFIEHSVPTPNSASVYPYHLDDLGIITEMGVVPIYKVAGKEREGQVPKTIENPPKEDLVEAFKNKDVKSVELQEYKDKGIVYENGLIAYYPFTTDASDFSKNNYDGILINGAHIEDNTLVFDGIDDYVDLNSNTGLRDINIYGGNYGKSTVAYWVNVKNSDKFNMVTGNLGGFFYSTAGHPSQMKKAIFRVYNSAGAEQQSIYPDSSMPINNEEWYYIAHTIDATSNEYKTYVNSVLIPLISPSVADPYLYISTNPSPSNHYNCFIGNPYYPSYSNPLNPINNYNLDGLIDDVAVYGRVLSQQEIEQLYNAGRSD